MTQSKLTGFYYTNLSQHKDHKPFQGLAPGDFTDMHGRKVSIKVEDLAEYVENTKELLDGVTTESGDKLGLPIDMMNHDHGNAAGWITDVFLEGDRVKFTPKWTEVGLELISKDLQRMFSPTINISEKTILGGSLTNWPATRDKRGKVLIRPIELSDGHIWLDMVEDDQNGDEPEQTKEEGVKGMSQMTDEIRAELRSMLNETLTELKADPALVNELFTNVQQKVNESIQQESERLLRENKVVELAKSLVQGSQSSRKGLPIKETDLAAALGRLDPEDFVFWSSFMTKIQTEGLVSFEELGHSGEKGSKKSLPTEIAKYLDEGSLKISDLGNPILALGNVEEYDLSKWS